MGMNLLFYKEINRLFIIVCCAVFTAGASAQEEAVSDPDPWIGFNRAMFSFNEGADKYLARPLAKGYRAITPDPVEKGISNVFDNLLEVRNILNGVLQWKWGEASRDTGRFLINSTVGVAGLFDVAKYAGLEKGDGEDFGQTLAVWGFDSGPYLVLPILGPSTLRDGLGLPLDTYSNPQTYIDHVPTRNTVRGLGLVETRAGLLKVEELVSGDKYLFFRDAYLQRREFLINDGEVVDDFGDGFGGEYGDEAF